MAFGQLWLFWEATLLETILSELIYRFTPSKGGKALSTNGKLEPDSLGERTRSIFNLILPIDAIHISLHKILNITTPIKI